MYFEYTDGDDIIENQICYYMANLRVYFEAVYTGGYKHDAGIFTLNKIYTISMIDSGAKFVENGAGTYSIYKENYFTRLDDLRNDKIDSIINE